MRLGLSYDLKQAVNLKCGAPEDALEEYDSPATIGYIRRALEEAGHEVLELGGGAEFLRNILNQQVDIVFNIAEGRGSYRSREAQAPSLLEMLDIPYTGSDPACLAISLDKPLTKTLARDAGVSTPDWFVFSREQDLDQTEWERLSFPAIVKPAWEGSSKGVHGKSLVNGAEEARTRVRELLGAYRQPVMIERFIEGDEVTVGVVGNPPHRQIIGLMRILPRKQQDRFVYSVEVKRDWRNLVDYEAPAVIPGGVQEQIIRDTHRVCDMIGCRDFARVDFRVSKDGMAYMLEINPLPGLGDYSDLVILALKMGWSHAGLIRAVFESALKRCPTWKSA